ncbi:MAG TPA: ABC transporter ATP-binding protein [Thermodesulfobacteriota bacterium]|nr:ABC transporter ATP-binding protein [Thermodesulfobacteriota bacterium]
MLNVEGIHTYYGSSHILFEVSLTVNKAEVVGLLGRNGAGKSTTLRSIVGLTPPKEGRITFNGEDITGQKAYALVRKGMAYVPDDRRVFADLNIDDNLEIVHNKKTDWNKERVYSLFPTLKEIRTRRSGNLSGGEQQMLTIGRALMSSPQLLLLDEPTEGLAPLIVRELENQILAMKDAGISILLSEQNVKSALKLISRAYVIDNGRIRFEGAIADFERNVEIKRKYLMV